VAFKFGGGSSISTDSPERMFQDFSDRKLKGLLTYQARSSVSINQAPSTNPMWR
jgi:hypothetical protein